jgi:hypothetical protein
LVIAAGVDQWNEAEIVGALLAVAEETAETRQYFLQRGIEHLAARKSR